jgi:hypothetical protein
VKCRRETCEIVYVGRYRRAFRKTAALRDFEVISGRFTEIN